MPLSVIGAGLSRTGTMSLKLALEQLGFGPCYHMTEFFQHPDHQALWDRAADGEAVDFELMFKDFAATTDTPANVFYAELAARYPDAKVVLSVRDPEAWFESITNSILKPGSEAMMGQTPRTGLFGRIYWRTFGGHERDRAYMVDYFNRWTAEVTAAIPAERLLVYDCREGWAPLCVFLGVPAPTADFPRINAREEFQSEDPRETGLRVLRGASAKAD